MAVAFGKALAVFSDVGLTSGFRESHLRFEVDGANAARGSCGATASEVDAPP